MHRGSLERVKKQPRLGVEAERKFRAFPGAEERKDER
jgi:hypothetical protein